MTLESTIEEGGLPPHSQVFWCDSRESRGGVACVGPDHGDSHIQGSRCEGRATKDG